MTSCLCGRPTGFQKPSLQPGWTASDRWFSALVRPRNEELLGRLSSGNTIDAPIVNGFGDVVGEGAKKIGTMASRIIQTGRIQQYMIAALVDPGVFSAAFLLLCVTTPLDHRRIGEERCDGIYLIVIIAHTFILFIPVLAAVILLLLPRTRKT